MPQKLYNWPKYNRASRQGAKLFADILAAPLELLVPKPKSKGTLRSLAAAQRRSERAARQRHNALVKRQSLLAKMAEIERATYEVEVYENRLDVLSSIHKDCGETWDWAMIRAAEPPAEPVNSCQHEQAAQSQLDNFKPSVADKILKRADRKRNELAREVEAARQLDEQSFHEDQATYEHEHAEWATTCDLASRILAGDPKAYIQAIEQLEPFQEMGELGSAIEFQAGNGSLMELSIHVNSEEVIPKEIKVVLKSGKLSIKAMPKAKFFEIYQDYICGCVLRCAREAFALLPVEMVIVTALGEVLNSKTGHQEETPILSVAIPRKALARLSFESLDPSDSMSNFVHNMKFKKTSGFSPVEKLTARDLQLASSDAETAVP